MSESSGKVLTVQHPLLVAPAGDIAGRQKTESNQTVSAVQNMETLTAAQQVLEYLKALYK